MATDHDLMQHADGELNERDAKEVDAHLAADPEARAKASALGELSELVRGHLELSVDAVPAAKFEAMWKSIDSATSTSAVKRPLTDSVPARPGLWGSMTGWVDRHRYYLLTSLASAGAVAALAIVLRSGGTTTSVIQRNGAINVQPAALRVAPEIESIDVPDGEGTVLNLEDEDGHTTVIWVSPADTVEGI